MTILHAIEISIPSEGQRLRPSSSTEDEADGSLAHEAANDQLARRLNELQRAVQGESIARQEMARILGKVHELIARAATEQSVHTASEVVRNLEQMAISSRQDAQKHAAEAARGRGEIVEAVKTSLRDSQVFLQQETQRSVDEISARLARPLAQALPEIGRRFADAQAVVQRQDAKLRRVLDDHRVTGELRTAIEIILDRHLAEAFLRRIGDQDGGHVYADTADAHRVVE